MYFEALSRSIPQTLIPNAIANYILQFPSPSPAAPALLRHNTTLTIQQELPSLFSRVKHAQYHKDSILQSLCPGCVYAQIGQFQPTDHLANKPWRTILFTFTSEQNRTNDYDYGSRVFRIRRHGVNSRGIVDHTVTVVETRKQIDSGSLEALLELLENVLENSEITTGVGRSWALLVRGVEFMFYEYHQHRPGNHHLLPWGRPDQPERNDYHVRWDAETIDWMLRGHSTQPPLMSVYLRGQIWEKMHLEHGSVTWTAPTVNIFQV